MDDDEMKEDKSPVKFGDTAGQSVVVTTTGPVTNPFTEQKPGSEGIFGKPAEKTV